MKCLIEKGLMLGNLVPVESPATLPPPHPSPTRGEGGVNVARLVPPLPLVGRGWGWGATP